LLLSEIRDILHYCSHL